MAEAGEGRRKIMGNTAAEFRQGWRSLAGSFLGIAGGFASLFFYSVGLFLRPISEEFGLSRGEASLQAAALAVANFVAVPIAGRLVDRFGALRPALFSMLALSIGFFVLARFVSGLVSFVLLSGLVTMMSAASNAVTFNRFIIARFRYGRGLALGLILTATGVGAMLLPPLLGPVIANHGWRVAYMTLGVTVLPLTLGMVLFLRGMEPAPAKHLTPEPIKTVIFCRPFATIALLIFLVAMAVLGTVVHLIPMLTDRGMSAVDAGMIASALGLAVIVGRVFTGRLLDLADVGILTACFLLLAAMGMLFLWSGNSALVVPGAMLTGFGLGMESDLIAFLVGRRFPLRSFGTAYGCVFAAHVAGAGVGPLLAGVLFDAMGDYTAWLLVAAASLAGAAIVAFLTERGSIVPPDEHAGHLQRA